VGVGHEHHDECDAQEEEPEDELREDRHRGRWREHGILAFVTGREPRRDEKDPPDSSVEPNRDPRRAAQRARNDQREKDQRPGEHEDQDPREPPEPDRHNAMLPTPASIGAGSPPVRGPALSVVERGVDLSTRPKHNAQSVRGPDLPIGARSDAPELGMRCAWIVKPL
jgi:hypothetical protein